MSDPLLTTRITPSRTPSHTLSHTLEGVMRVVSDIPAGPLFPESAHHVNSMIVKLVMLVPES